MPTLVLLCGQAWAHPPPDFELEAPSGAANRAEHDAFTLRWRDGELPTANFDLRVVDRPIPPYASYEVPNVAGTLIGAGLATGDAVNELVWNTATVLPGCYQPYALLRDLGEPFSYVAHGKIAVSEKNAAYPTIWISAITSPVSPTSRDFAVEVEVDDPDSTSSVRLSYATGRAGEGLVALPDTIALPLGGGKGVLHADLSGIDPGTYSVYAEVTADDGARCSVFWPYPVYVQPLLKSANDGGTTDGRARAPSIQDGSTLEGGADASVEGGAARRTAPTRALTTLDSNAGPQVGGCGCRVSPGRSSNNGWILALAAITVALRRSRQKFRPGNC